MTTSLVPHTVLVALALVSGAAGCQSPHRALRVGDDSVTLAVTMSGLKADDQNKTAWVYELSGCDGIPTLNGVLQPPPATPPATPNQGVVNFTAPGLKQALTGCQFRVKILQAQPTQSFIYEQGTLYWARSVDITEDQTGALVSTAELQIVYTSKPVAGPVFEASVPVKFPAADGGKAFFGELANCTPGVTNPGTYTAINATEGNLLFVLPVGDVTCTDLYVGVDGLLRKYHAVLPAASQAIHVPAGGPAQLPEIVLTQQLVAPPKVVTPPPPPASAGSVEVSTTGAQCTGADRHYDESSFSCVCNDTTKKLVGGTCQ